MSLDESARIVEALRAAEEGRFDGAIAILGQSEGSGEDVGHRALRIAAFHAGLLPDPALDDEPPPKVRSPPKTLSPAFRPTGVSPEIAALSLVHFRRSAFLRGNVAELNALRPPHDGPGHILHNAWAAVLEDRPAEEFLEALSAAPDAGVELGVLRALSSLREHDLEGATTHARAASRAAIEEGRPQGEYLAHLVLARVRRASGSPHLSVRILRSLRSIAPRAWHGWIDYESALSGARPPIASDAFEAEAPIHHAARFVRATLDADRAPPSLTHVAGLALPRFIIDELTELLLLTRPAAPGDHQWLRGKTSAVPRGLHGVALSEDPNARVSFVWAAPDTSARRFLCAGGQVLRSEGQALCEAPHPQERTATGLSVLLLAEGKVAVDAFFQQLYGFRYDPKKHKGVLDTLVRRMRDALGGAGHIEREDNELGVRVIRPVLVPDPRCAVPLEDRVLAYLAARGGQSAKSASHQLAVPLRTVQQALRGLAEDGSCVVRRVGRTVEYAVEDTTFSEPTRVG